MLDDNLLQDFISGFYGYGNYAAPFWFIGMEEGGGGSVEEITRRLNAWNTRDRRELEDLDGYHHAIGITRYWDDPVRLQSTWNRLIRVRMGINGQVPSSRDVKVYQRDQLGRENGETCLLELAPLPSPSASKWIYGGNSSLPYLATRKRYLEKVAAMRIRHIKAKVAVYRPALVLFYGIGYMRYWEQIAGVSLELHGTDGFYGGKRDGTVFVATKHPAARGLTNEYFHVIGQWISAVTDG